MNKKVFGLILPLLATSLSSCVLYNGRNKDGTPKSTTTSTPSTEPTSENTTAPTVEPIPVEPGAAVTYYLNLGKYGKLNNVAGTEQVEVFLEYAVKISGQSGDVLPDKNAVTSDTFGVTFDHWVLSGTQDIYTQVPNLNNCILVAVFSGSSEGGGGSHTEGERTTNFPSTGYGFKFSNGTGYVGTPAGQDYSGRDQYVIRNAYFLQGETFQLYDFAKNVGWADPLDPWSLGGTSDTSENWKEYLQKNSNTNYTVLKDFTSEEIYIKLRYEDNMIYFK